MILMRRARRGRFVADVLLVLGGSLLSLSLPLRAQTDAPKKPLSVERIFSQPSLSGQLTRGLAWSADGRRRGFFAVSGSGKDAKTEWWVMDVGSGERRLLVSADKLASMLPAPPENASQATGLGRRTPSQYLWSPGGDALLFVGDTSFTWFDLKSQTPRALA